MGYWFIAYRWKGARGRTSVRGRILMAQAFFSAQSIVIEDDVVEEDSETRLHRMDDSILMSIWLACIIGSLTRRGRLIVCKSRPKDMPCCDRRLYCQGMKDYWRFPIHCKLEERLQSEIEMCCEFGCDIAGLGFWYEDDFFKATSIVTTKKVSAVNTEYSTIAVVCYLRNLNPTRGWQYWLENPCWIDSWMVKMWDVQDQTSLNSYDIPNRMPTDVRQMWQCSADNNRDFWSLK